MRKVTATLLTLAIIAGGGAWYVLSYLPDRIRADIEQTIAALKPDLEISFSGIEIDLMGDQATLNDVFVRSEPFEKTVRAATLTVTRNGDLLDATLERLTVATPRKELFTVGTLVLAGIRPPPSPAAEGDTTEAWRDIEIKRITARDYANTDGIWTVQTAVLEDLRQAKFGKATVSTIEAKDDKGSFSVGDISAEEIDVAKLVNLPRTLGGLIEWSHLDTGKAAVRSIELDLKEVGRIGVREIAIDGIKAGRLVRFSIEDISADGGDKHPDIRFNLKKIELNDFPIITDFPTTREELITFQTRHKSLIYGGFDVRGFDLQTEDGGMNIDYVTMPPPKFGNTSSGKRYISDATSRMKMSIDLGIFDKADKPLDPQVRKILTGEKLTVLMTGTTLQDHAKKTMTIQDTTVSVPENISLKMSGAVGNLPLRYFETPGDPLVQQIALQQMTLSALELTLTNDGIAERLFDVISEREGIPRENIPRQLAAVARAKLAGDGSAEARALAEQIGIFLENPKSLRLVLRPTRPVVVRELADPRLLQSAGRVSEILGLKLIANEGMEK